MHEDEETRKAQIPRNKGISEHSPQDVFMVHLPFVMSRLMVRFRSPAPPPNPLKYQGIRAFFLPSVFCCFGAKKHTFTPFAPLCTPSIKNELIFTIEDELIFSVLFSILPCRFLSSFLIPKPGQSFRLQVHLLTLFDRKLKKNRAGDVVLPIRSMPEILVIIRALHNRIVDIRSRYADPGDDIRIISLQ